MSFVWYPEIGDANFYDATFKKKEFNKTLTGPEFHSRDPQEVCRPGEFKMQNHQEFVRNFISPETPYNGLLLFHGTGVGKCVHPDTIIFVNDEPIRIEDLWKNYSINQSVDEDGGEWANVACLKFTTASLSDNGMVDKPIAKLYRQRVSETLISVRTEAGNHIKMTKAHRLLSNEGFTNNLEPGMGVAQPIGYGHGDTECALAFVPIESIVEEDYDGYVYDLEISNTHNYVANGILCHNTCAAMGITEGLKEYVHKMGKKIYIISSKVIRDNFLRELYDEKRANREKQMHSPPGSYQCVGDAYHVSELEYPDPAKRKRKIAEKIRKYYEFFGAAQFANYVDVKLKMLKKMTDDEIAEFFANSVFVIDEAHGIAGKGKLEERTKKSKKDEVEEEEPEDVADEGDEGEEDDEAGDEEVVVERKKTKTAPKTSNRSLLMVLLDIIKGCRKIKANLKLVLLTATPMKDNQGELADLLQLLNENDGRSIDRGALFAGEESFNSALLAKYARGYVSYVRGNNPITFPLPLLPPTDMLYNPDPLYSYDGDGIIRAEYTIPLDKEGTKFYEFNLVKCPMSLYQFKAYKGYRDGKAVKERSDAADIYGRQISNFVFPSNNTNEVMTTSAKPSVPVDKLYGQTGLRELMNEQKISLGAETKIDGKPARPKQHLCYEYKDATLQNFGLFLSLQNPVSGKEKFNLALFSQKFAKVVENINASKGIAYAYSEFDAGGARTLALALEANGYIRYHPDLKFKGEDKVKEAGLPINLDKIPQCRLLAYNGSKPSEYYTNYLKGNFRCAVCGLLYAECRSENAKNADKHVFRQATYIIYTGSIGKEAEIDYLRDEGNTSGYKIKAILGTKITGEGLDFKWIRQVHIVDPWHNNTRIYQAIGRGIRHCSHIDLPIPDRNVTIFKYSSSVPEVTAVIGGEDVDVTSPYEDLVTSGLVKDSQHDSNVQILLPKSKSGAPVNIGFTYRDLLTETMDEKMYSRVVRKDIYIKRIERVLKEVAVDCSLNRHINYYGESDRDYSRECDYDRCDYTCKGFTEAPEFFDLSARANPDDTYSIRSEKIFGDIVWRTEIGEDHYASLREEASSFGLDLDFDSEYDGEMQQDYIKDVYDTLLKTVGRTQITIMGEEVHFERSYTDVDISTYNVHFAQPQIIKARMYIARLFQHSVALSEKQIVSLVLKHDPLVDEEFIRLAIDQLVGNPPYIAPKEIRDKYNRSGHIIFVGGYYVFQPADIEDRTIPIYYRVNPLKIKRHHLSMDPLVTVSEATQDATYVLDETMLGKRIEELYKYVGFEEVGDQLLNRMMIHSTMDKMVLNDQAYIIRTVIKRNARDASDTDAAELAIVLKEYYKSQHLLYESPDGNKIYLLIDPENEVSVFDMSVDKPDWAKYGYSDESVSDLLELVGQDYLRVVNVSGDEPSDGIYGFLAPAKVTRAKTMTVDAIPVDIELVKRTLKNLNSYVKVQRDTETLKFKIVDKHIESVREKRAGGRSAKTFSSGIVCTTKNESVIGDIIAVIDEIFATDILNYDDPLNGESTVPSDIFDSSKFVANNKTTLCNKLEIALRLLDYINYNDKKWFLTPFEIEYYRPMASST